MANGMPKLSDSEQKAFVSVCFFLFFFCFSLPGAVCAQTDLEKTRQRAVKQWC